MTKEQAFNLLKSYAWEYLYATDLDNSKEHTDKLNEAVRVLRKALKL